MVQLKATQAIKRLQVIICQCMWFILSSIKPRYVWQIVMGFTWIVHIDNINEGKIEINLLVSFLSGPIKVSAGNKMFAYAVLFSCYGYYHKKENRRLVGNFYDMKNWLWAVGCGLCWAVVKKVWADYEQLLREVFSTFCGQKKKKKILKTLYRPHWTVA